MLIKNYWYCFYANECKLKAIYIYSITLKLLLKKENLVGLFLFGINMLGGISNHKFIFIVLPS